MIPKYVVAIDLGTTKIVSIVGEKTEHGRYRILAYSETVSHGIRRGQVEQIHKVMDSVTPTLEAIKAETGITDLGQVFVGIAGQYITCIENKVEKIRSQFDEMISVEEIKELETNAGKLHINAELEILHIIPQNYSVDDRIGITDPVGRLGNKLTGYFYVITGNKSTRTNTEVCMDKLNLSLQQLILEPIASARAALFDEEKEAGVAMIDIGGGTTDLIIYKDNILVSTVVIPFGGNSITEDIKTYCSILFNQAEKIKIEFGLDANRDEFVRVNGISGHPFKVLPLNDILETIIFRLNEIITMVLYEINKIQCGKLGAGLVVTGGVSQMKGIKKFLENRLKQEAAAKPELLKKMNIEVTISAPKYISDSDENIIHPKYSTAVGLIMCGFDYLDNLLMTEKEKEKEKEKEEAEKKLKEEAERKIIEEEERKKKEEEERKRIEAEKRMKREAEEKERIERERKKKTLWREKSHNWFNEAYKTCKDFLKQQVTDDEKND
jgi:cell division protein FtsA